ncbi:hypothetical protein KSH_10465 [Moraxella osloensis]|nr:hypothetical protein KSH_10465 [Moraxella osloensis]
MHLTITVFEENTKIKLGDFRNHQRPNQVKGAKHSFFNHTKNIKLLLTFRRSLKLKQFKNK